MIMMHLYFNHSTKQHYLSSVRSNSFPLGLPWQDLFSAVASILCNLSLLNVVCGPMGHAGLRATQLLVRFGPLVPSQSQQPRDIK